MFKYIVHGVDRDINLKVKINVQANSVLEARAYMMNNKPHINITEVKPDIGNENNVITVDFINKKRVA